MKKRMSFFIKQEIFTFVLTLIFSVFFGGFLYNIKQLCYVEKTYYLGDPRVISDIFSHNFFDIFLDGIHNPIFLLLGFLCGFSLFVLYTYSIYKSLVSKGIDRSTKNDFGSQRWSKPKELQSDFETMQIDINKVGEITEIRLPSSSLNYSIQGKLSDGSLPSTTLKGDDIEYIDGFSGMMFAVRKESVVNPDIDTFYLDISASNKIIIGVSRTGKGRRLLIPNILLNISLGGNMFIHDPKGELYEKTAGFAKANGYDVIYYNFKDLDPRNKDGHIINESGLAKSSCFNPLEIIYMYRWEYDNIGMAKSKLESLAEVLVGDPKAPDQHWPNSAKALFKTMAWILLEQQDKKIFTLPNVYDLLTEFSDLYGDETKTNYILKYIQSLSSRSTLKRFLAPISSSVGSPRAMSGILSTTTTKLQDWIASEDLMRILSKSDVDFSNLSDEKVIIYAITPDGKSIGDKLIAVMIDQLYGTLTTFADSNISNGKKLNRNFDFILDEFGNFPQIPDFENKMTQCLSREIRFWLALQSKEQLDEVYGKEKTKIIMDNCQTYIYLKSLNYAANELMSKALGNYTMEKTNANKKGEVTSVVTAQRALMTPGELSELTHDVSIVRRMTTLVVRHPERFRLVDIAQTNIIKKYGISIEAPPAISFNENDLPLFNFKQAYLKKPIIPNEKEKPNEVTINMGNNASVETEDGTVIYIELANGDEYDVMRQDEYIIEELSPNINIKEILEEMNVEMSKKLLGGD